MTLETIPPNCFPAVMLVLYLLYRLPLRLRSFRHSEPVGILKHDVGAKHSRILEHLVHLPVPHLDGQEDHDKRCQPNTASTEPQDALALASQKRLCGEGSYYTRQSTDA